jgi:hypothetical protein
VRADLKRVFGERGFDYLLFISFSFVFRVNLRPMAYTRPPRQIQFALKFYSDCVENRCWTCAMEAAAEPELRRGS